MRNEAAAHGQPFCVECPHTPPRPSIIKTLITISDTLPRER